MSCLADDNRDVERRTMEWQPISDDEFAELFRTQYAELTPEEQRVFESFRVKPWKATIRRSDDYGDELVWVVSQHKDWVLYFDDVEYGFNPSPIDASGRILERGGNQNTLREAVVQWMLPD